MSTENKLTVADPISQETLSKFQQLAQSRAQLSEQYVDLDNEKIRLQIAIRQIDQEKQRLFESVLVERGLTPTTPVEIDSQTGLINVLTPAGAPQAEEPPAT